MSNLNNTRRFKSELCCRKTEVGMRWLTFFLAPIAVLIAARVAVRSSAALRVQIAVQLMGWDGVGEIAKEAFATRMLGSKTTASRTEFLGLLDALAEADEKYLSPTGRAVVDADDIAEGHKYLQVVFAYPPCTPPL